MMRKQKWSSGSSTHQIRCARSKRTNLLFLPLQSSVEGDVPAHVAAKPVKPTKADVLHLLQELLKQHFPRAARQVT